jgi:hypothetical protein
MDMIICILFDDDVSTAKIMYCQKVNGKMIMFVLVVVWKEMNEYGVF